MDVTALGVTLVSVVGTLGGTLGGAVLSQRANRTESAVRDHRADQEREETRREQAEVAKRALYARLNTAARAYRVAARDAVLAAERGERVDPLLLDVAKDAWAEEYSQAQMSLPADVLTVASALNRALGLGYAVVRRLPGSRDPGGAYEQAKTWFAEPLSDGVHLLRVTLRHDLGVEVDPEFEQTRVRMLAELGSARNILDRMLAAERSRVARVASGRTPLAP